jgi:hypothetical protein
VIALVLAELNALTKLEAGEVKAVGFKAVGVETNDDVRSVESP